MLNILRLVASGFALLLTAGTAAAQETPICTDRPAKANAVCTTPVGKFQLESTIAGLSRTEAGGARTDIWSVGSSVLKVGLTDRSDLQLDFVPWVRLETRQVGRKTGTSGIGDMTVRYKHRLSRDAAPIQIGFIPFVKVPTAGKRRGNGKVEGGLAVPIRAPIGKSLTLTLGPELDLLVDADGGGHHLAVINLVNLSTAVAPRLTLAGELWTSTNFDPSGKVTQATLDVAGAYAAAPRLQFDAGANFGLNRNSVDVEIYAGVSTRF